MTDANRQSLAVHAHDRRGNVAGHPRRGDAQTATGGSSCPVASGVLLALAASELRTVSKSFIGSIAVRWPNQIPVKRVKVTW